MPITATTPAVTINRTATATPTAVTAAASTVTTGTERRGDFGRAAAARDIGAGCATAL